MPAKLRLFIRSNVIRGDHEREVNHMLQVRWATCARIRRGQKARRDRCWRVGAGSANRVILDRHQTAGRGSADRSVQMFVVRTPRVVRWRRIRATIAGSLRPGSWGDRVALRAFVPRVGGATVQIFISLFALLAVLAIVGAAVSALVSHNAHRARPNLRDESGYAGWFSNAAGDAGDLADCSNDCGDGGDCGGGD